MTTEANADATPLPFQRWYRKRGNCQDGPWLAEQLLVEVASGRVLPDDLVKSDAMSEWVVAKSVKGLEFGQKPVKPPPLPVKPPPLPSKARPRLIPPSLPNRQTAAMARRSQSVIWGYFGAALIVLTVGLGVAVVILKDRERAETASSPPTSGSFEPLLTDRLNTQSTQSHTPVERSEQTSQPKTEPTQSPQSQSPSNRSQVPAQPMPESGPPAATPPTLKPSQPMPESGPPAATPPTLKPSTAPTPKPLAAGESVALRGHNGYVSNVAFSKDGSRLLTVSQQGPVVLWDVASRSQVWSADVPGDLRAGAFIDAGRKIAVQRAGGLVTLDAGSGKVVDEARFPANGWGKFSPDGKVMALYRDGSIYLHDVPTGREEYQKREYFTAYAFSPTGRHCFAAMYDLYRLSIPDFRPDKLKPHQSSTIQCMDCSPDGKRLVTGSGRIWDNKLKKDIQGDNCVRVWEIQSGEVVATLRGHGGWLWSVCYHPDGKRVLSGGSGRSEPLDFYGHQPGADTSLRLWDVATQRQLERFEGHTAAVLDIKCSPDGRYAATGSADGTVRLWHLPK